MMNEFDVNILIPPARDESEDVTISGPRENVAQAINALNKRVDEIEAENEDKVGDKVLFKMLVGDKIFKCYSPFNCFISSRINIVEDRKI